MKFSIAKLQKHLKIYQKSLKTKQKKQQQRIKPNRG